MTAGINIIEYAKLLAKVRKEDGREVDAMVLNWLASYLSMSDDIDHLNGRIKALIGQVLTMDKSNKKLRDALREITECSAIQTACSQCVSSAKQAMKDAQ